MIMIHLVDYILEGNHAVFEHPIPGVQFSMTTVVQVNVLQIPCTDLGGSGSLLDLRQNHLGIDNGVGVSKEDAL